MGVLGGTLGALRGPGVLRGIQWGLRWVLGTLGGSLRTIWGSLGA